LLEPNPCLHDADQAGKEAHYATTGINLKLQALIALKLKLVLYLKRLQLFFSLTPMRENGNLLLNI